MSNIKMVIVVRKDLNMRLGKSCAQVAHASQKVFFDRMMECSGLVPIGSSSCNTIDNTYICDFIPEMIEWMKGSFTKIVVGCNSEHELFDLQKQADEAGIVNALILDEGRTEFHGSKTATCLAIGPDESEKIDKITGGLKLL